MPEEYKIYLVEDRIEETSTTTTLQLAPKKGRRPDFIPGQFVNVLLPSRGMDAKSYTISSIPADRCLSISVRSAGEFSQTLAAYTIGKELSVSEPYGYFYPVDDTTPRVFLAGGIGVMPFVSIIRASLGSGMPQTLLLYSNRTVGDIPFRSLLDELEKNNPQLLVRYCVTREHGSDEDVIYNHIDKPLLLETLQEYHAAHFFLCGSIAFVRDMRLALKALGVVEDAIFTEAFF
jgi:nitric oxide dioxygenase